MSNSIDDNYDSGFDLVLSNDIRKELTYYYYSTCLPQYLTEKGEDLWYGIQIGDRMFDLNVWTDFGGILDKEEIVCTVYECDWDGTQNNWKTNCRYVWILTDSKS